MQPQFENSKVRNSKFQNGLIILFRFGIWDLKIVIFRGAVAQLVEQRTENPCVAGSIPAHTTKEDSLKSGSFLWVKILVSPVPCPTAGGDSGPHHIENQAIMKKIRSRFFLWYNIGTTNGFFLENHILSYKQASTLPELD